MLCNMLYNIHMVTLSNYVEMVLNSLQVLENLVFVICSRMNTIFVKMRQNAHFETTTTCKTSKIVVEAKEKYVL